jgi:hypothetical protein
MEELWYKQEEKQALMEEAATQTREPPKLDTTLPPEMMKDISGDKSATGPWLFISNNRNLTIVRTPSRREVDQISGASTYYPGTKIKFNVGRFQTSDPEEVDFLISKKECGSHFTPAFNVEAYKAARRLIYDLPEKEVVQPVAPNFPKFPGPMPKEEHQPVEEEDIIQDDQNDFFNEPTIIIPTVEEADEVLQQPMTVDPRVDELERKVDRIGVVLEAISSKLLKDDEAEQKAVKPKEESEYKGYQCKRCGMTGFSSGYEVSQHRKSGECNRVLAERLVNDSTPKMVTGPNTAGGRL